MDEDGKVTTYAGGEDGCALGDLETVQFSGPTGLCWADGVLYVADTGNGGVRAIREGYVTMLLSPGRSGTYPISPRSLLCCGDALYMGDVFARVLVSLPAKVTEPVFYDVEEDTWYAQAVRFTAANGLFAGIEEHVFAPDILVTRAMIVTVLARLEGVDTTTGSTWYEAGRQWAVENGISDGANMDSTLTREQLATMLWNYSGKPAASGLSGYTDAGSVSDWASQAMAWCVEQGIIGGTTTTDLSPQVQATRAQVAAVLMRLVESSAW